MCTYKILTDGKIEVHILFWDGKYIFTSILKPWKRLEEKVEWLKKEKFKRKSQIHIFKLQKPNEKRMSKQVLKNKESREKNASEMFTFQRY